MKQTSEQRTATERLRALPGGYRITTDPEGWPVITGRLGQIEHHDGPNMAVFTDRVRMHARLLAIPGIRRHQTGDQELRALFPPSALSLVAGAVKARRKRTVSAASLQNLAAGREAGAATRFAARQEVSYPTV